MHNTILRYEAMTIEGVAQVARGFERIAFLLFLVFAMLGAALVYAAIGGFVPVSPPQAAGLLVAALGSLAVAVRALIWAGPW